MRPDRSDQELIKSNGTPWWVKAITYFGVPSTIALFLVYLLGVTVMGKLTIIESALVSHANISARHADESRDLRRILQQICVNSARTSVDRTACFP